MPTLIEIADALADSLDAVAWTTFAGPVTTTRVKWATTPFTPEEMAGGTIAVAATGIEATRISRTAHQHDKQLAVFVARAVESDAEADDMSDWAEEIAEKIEEHDWSTYAPSVTWPAGITSPQDVTVTINPDDGLSERNVWRAVIAVSYRVARAH